MSRMSPVSLVGPGLREELIAAGVLIETAVPGLWQRSGRFERVLRGVEDAVHRRATEVGAAHGGYGEVRYLPPVMPREQFVRTDYLRSFPDLVGSVHVFAGDDRAHRDLLALVEEDGEWAGLLTPGEVVLCSAACHSLYAVLPTAVPAEGLRAELQGTCFRHEPSADPARMQSFRMHELVCVGDPEQALTHRDRWLEAGRDLLASLGLPVQQVVANDPFFGRAGRLLARNQRQEELKYELVCPVGSTERPTAIASGNYHLDHFGEPFGLRLPGGEVAHSACFGFGLERITLALFAHHGTDPEGWPAAVAERLWA